MDYRLDYMLQHVGTRRDVYWPALYPLNAPKRPSVCLLAQDALPLDDASPDSGLHLVLADLRHVRGSIGGLRGVQVVKGDNDGGRMAAHRLVLAPGVEAPDHGQPPDWHLVGNRDGKRAPAKGLDVRWGRRDLALGAQGNRAAAGYVGVNLGLKQTRRERASGGSGGACVTVGVATRASAVHWTGGAFAC